MGFRTGRSTTECIFILNNVINKQVESGKTLYAFFVDYSKAFDYDVRENLLYKLLKWGVNEKILKIVLSMNSYVKTSVFSDGEKFKQFDSVLGVRPGEFIAIFICYLFTWFRGKYCRQRVRCRFYSVVKPQHQLSKYLQCVTCKPHRMALSRFNISSHFFMCRDKEVETPRSYSIWKETLCLIQK